MLSLTASAAGKLDAWIDFNGDGSWGGPGEQIFSSVALTPGVNSLSFDVPSYAKVATTYARFRLSSSGGLGVAGRADDGEVEDYSVQILRLTQPAERAALPLAVTVAGNYSSITTVYAADIDGDGDVDSLTAAFDSSRVAWQANDGHGTFGPDKLISNVGNASSAVPPTWMAMVTWMFDFHLLCQYHYLV